MGVRVVAPKEEIEDDQGESPNKAVTIGVIVIILIVIIFAIHIEPDGFGNLHAQLHIVLFQRLQLLLFNNPVNQMLDDPE